MWSHLPVHNLIWLQRIAALKKMGQEARELLEQGYAVDADRVLDEMNARRERWRDEALGQDREAA
jgi:hypothetical protein